MTATAPSARERDDLVQTLGTHRHFLRYTARDLTDEQARTRSTVSELTVGGLIKHVTRVERTWANFIVDGPSAFGAGFDESRVEEHLDSFRMGPDETLDGLLATYADVAARTDELVRTEPSLDAEHALPEAPWFPPGAMWSVRRAVLHIVAETAQHAGHADVVREGIDGAKTMG